MYVCIYVYVCIYLCVCLYMFVYIYVYTHTHIHICSFVCVSFFRRMDDPYRQTPFAGTIDHLWRLEGHYLS